MKSPNVPEPHFKVNIQNESKSRPFKSRAWRIASLATLGVILIVLTIPIRQELNYRKAEYFSDRLSQLKESRENPTS